MLSNIFGYLNTEKLILCLTGCLCYYTYLHTLVLMTPWKVYDVMFTIFSCVVSRLQHLLIILNFLVFFNCIMLVVCHMYILFINILTGYVWTIVWVVSLFTTFIASHDWYHSSVCTRCYFSLQVRWLVDIITSFSSLASWCHCFCLIYFSFAIEFPIYVGLLFFVSPLSFSFWPYHYYKIYPQCDIPRYCTNL